MVLSCLVCVILRLGGELVVKINGFIVSNLCDPKVGWRARSKKSMVLSCPVCVILRLVGELVIKINGFIMCSLCGPKVGWRARSKNQWFYHV